MFHQDDIVPVPFQYRENIDYLDITPNEYLDETLNLMTCVKFTTKKADSQNIRLRNCCWRRSYKNLKGLSELNPTSINWDKNSDFNWLYGPKFDYSYNIRPSTTTKPQSDMRSKSADIQVHKIDDGYMSGASSIADSASSFSDLDLDIDDSSSISSIDSGYLPDYNNKKVSLPVKKSFYAYEDYEEENSPKYHDQFTHLKSNLKQTQDSSSPFLMKTSRKAKKHTNRVSFNYIINSREYINGISFDYDFLDQACL